VLDYFAAHPYTTLQPPHFKKAGAGPTLALLFVMVFLLTDCILIY